jgi:CubicO group peptidase (beta-lactamase class C family)
VDGMTEVELRGQELGDQSPLAPLNATEPWPLGTFFQMDENWPADVDRKCVEDAIDLDFSVDEYRARSMLIVRNGEMMFERYSDDVNEASPLLGWSMTKTLTVAMVGILVDEGRLDLNARLGADGLVPEWGGLLNRKRDITLNELVQMRTGILWTESWHLVNCLYNSGGDCAKYYAELPLVNEPGEVFDYSTGASMLLSRIVMENRGDPELTDFEWVRARLFKPLGMTSALVEPMPPGYFGGGSFGYMTARDWARLGHLFMHDGLWEDGTRIFSQEFGEYIRTASPATTEYGGQTWILDNYEGVSDAYYMSGFRFQKVINIPSMGLSIVRHAMAPLVLSLGDYWSIRDFLDTLLPCFPEFPANN